MGSILQQVLSLITTSPGNLAYHAVVAFSVAGALQAALLIWRDQEFPQVRRMIFGLGLLLFSRILLFGFTGLTVVGLADPHVLLPIVDRAITAICVVIIIWLWTFPEATSYADAASGLLVLLILVTVFLTGIWWAGNSDTVFFNKTPASYGWEILTLFILILGGTLLLIRRPNGWEYGIIILSISTLGHLAHLLLLDSNSDFPGMVRLAQLVFYPILWALPYRFNAPMREKKTAVTVPQPEEVTFRERSKFGIEPNVFDRILSLALSDSQLDRCQKLTQTIAQALLADICILIYPPQDDDVYKIECGYDLIRQEQINSKPVHREQIPMLASAMQRLRPLRLPASSTSRDLFSIGQMLSLGRTGHLLAAFLPSTEEDKAIMGIVVLSPYSDRRWSREDQEYLNSIVTKLASFLQQGIDITKLEKSLSITEQNLKSFQNLLEASQAENAGLRDELRRISQKGYEEKDLDLANIQSKHTDALEKIEQLQIENIKLQELLANIQSTESQSREDEVDYHEELQLTLQEMARLQKQLSDSDVQLLELQKKFIAPETMSDEQIEVFTSIVQELRQPMSSIVGYTDLLLGESVGILGALQRKFLDRIKVSTERMDILITDLFQVVTMDSGGLEIRPESVDLGVVIDDAIADAKTQFQQRGIVLRVDLPTEMPQLQADRDALQQILIQLLKNAGTASPENGEIFFRTSLYQTEDHQDFVLMQVADQGGGIPKEDLPRVFSRLYRANNPLIQGVGDTGVGLSIVKTLVDAHHGRIWVDTEMGKGSTFSLLLPLSNNDTPFTTLEEEQSL